MYKNCILQSDKMESTVKEILDVLGGHIEVDTVLDYIQNDPNYGNNNLSIKQVNEYAQRLALKSSNSKLFLKKYEEMKCKDPKNLADIFTLIYKLSCEERKSKSGKPRVAPKPILGDSKYLITKDDLPQIKEKLLKAVDESKKLVLKSFEEKESKSKPNIYHSLDIPDWFKDFPTMSWDFPKEALPINHGLAGIPVESQESIIVNELLYIFSGIPGNYIVHQPVNTVYEPRKFLISEDMDSSLRQMVEPMLQLASHYSVVRRFIESVTMSSGQVIHALVAAVEVLLKDYYILLAQLESEHMSGGLSLYKLWYFIVPTSHSMQTLANILTSIAEKNYKGGEVISILHTKTNALMGDMKAQEIAFFLTEHACQPYLKILHKWIHKGSIEDPFQEFMIEDNEIVNKDELPIEYSDDYWEKRYSLQIDRVPKFLEDYTDKILRTGKYLNVISQCGKNIQNTDSVEMKYAMRESNCGAVISNAYTFASTSLLELLLNEYDLMGRLKSVKNYFLISQGDFIVQFMDATEQELAKKIDDIIPSKLESLLGLCLKLSAAKHDPYSEDMRVELLPYDLQYQMCKIQSIETDEEKEYRQKKESIPLTGIEAFSFGVEVKWPVSLVLNHKAISCYQMIFRHLFYCKHVERLLCRVWLYNKVVKRFAEGRLYAEAFALRQRMLSCIQHLQYYMCVEVIEPSWTQLIQNLKKVDNVDEVIERHSDFYETCLADCMLTDSKLLRTVTALCLVCVQFCSFIQSTGCGSNPQPIEPDSFSNKVNRFGQRFTAALLSLLGIIDDKDNNTKKLLNISARLRFNTYYEKEIESFLLQYKQMDGDKNNM